MDVHDACANETLEANLRFALCRPKCIVLDAYFGLRGHDSELDGDME